MPVVGQHKMAGQHGAEQVREREGRAWQGRAGQGRSKQDETPSRAWLYITRTQYFE